MVRTVKVDVHVATVRGPPFNASRHDDAAESSLFQKLTAEIQFPSDKQYELARYFVKREAKHFTRSLIKLVESLHSAP